MEIQEGHEETVYKYNFECTDEEEVRLCKLALEEFAKDKPAQLEYAVLHILKKAVEDQGIKAGLIKPPKKRKSKKEQ